MDINQKVKNIGTKIILLITILVFIFIIIKEFLSKYLPKDSTKDPIETFLQLSLLIIPYILSYILYSSIQDQLKEKINYTKHLNIMLNVILVFVCYIIFHMGSIEKIESIKYIIVKIILINLFNISLIILSILSFLLPVFLFLIWQEKYMIKNRKKGEKIKMKLKEKFSRKKIWASFAFSLIVGVTYWATTVYKAAFETGKWGWPIAAFFLVALVLLVFGTSFLELFEKIHNLK